MSSLYLVRHGQAGLRHDYDTLSDLGRTQACGNTWSFPALANGKLFVRDGRQLACFELGGE